jgi:hypothetical protein
MPGKRPIKKGSFGGHFDELVKHFSEERPKALPGKQTEKKQEAGCVHDRLFASAWAKARREAH